MRDALQFRILISIRDGQMQGLDETDREAIQSIVASNKQLFTTINSQTEKIMERQDADSSLASTRHNEVLHAITKQKIRKYSVKDVARTISESLNFTRKDDRYDDIVAAHNETFNWALDGRTNDSISWPSLADWLRQDGGVYWISGKAGSGKSTLMKYLYQDPRVMEALNVWAGDDPLIVVDYYFWNSGAEIQRSQEGLFRSLLWQVLDQNISLASTLFPELFVPHSEWDGFPTFHQLRRAFGRLTSQSLTSTKIAIVIDGLDEFDARRVTMTELGDMLINATKGGNIKALLSSRPLTPFTDCFKDHPQLELHQLTHDDITRYVYDCLSVHPQMVHLTATYKDETKALVEEIVSSASGVFLWVKLVVRSLLEGLQNGDQIEDLQLRLRDLPQDIEALFTRMLSDVPTSYKSQAACIFDILRCNNQGQKRTQISLRKTERPLTAIALSYAEAKIEEVLGAKISPLSNEELEQRENTTERRLRSRCAGLLELRTRGKYERQEASMVESRDRKEVVYLHRTVADFLHKKEVWDEITSHAKILRFCGSLAVLQSLVMEVKKVKLAHNILWDLFYNTMIFAQLAKADTRTSCRQLLDELDRTMKTHIPDFRRSWKARGDQNTTWCQLYTEDYQRPTPWYENFMSLSIRFGLILYVQDSIRERGRDCLVKHGRPLLDYACAPEPTSRNWPTYNDPKLVQILLENGADPNAKFDGSSAWQNCLYSETINPVKWISILKLLLLHGADADACIRGRHDRQTALNVMQRCFDELLAGDTQATEQALERFNTHETQQNFGAASAETLAQLKLDIIELKGLLTKRGTGDQDRGAGNRPGITLFIKRLFRRGNK
jgi:hypothetical protein